MEDQRRNQRIRFGTPPPVKLGIEGARAWGALENLSLSGCMVRTHLPLAVGANVACEFSIFGSSTIDIIAVVVSRVGNLFGARFKLGPISDVLVKDAIDHAISSGQASIVSMHRQNGRRVMRIAGGLNGTLANDFTYSLTKVGVDEMDLSAVTLVDAAGLELCVNAIVHHGASIGDMSECFAEAWKHAVIKQGKVVGAK